MDPVEVFLRNALKQKGVEDRAIRAALKRLRPVMAQIRLLITDSGVLALRPDRERLIAAVTSRAAQIIQQEWGQPALDQFRETLGPYLNDQAQFARDMVESAGGTLNRPNVVTANPIAATQQAMVGGRPLVDQMLLGIPAQAAERLAQFIRMGSGVELGEVLARYDNAVVRRVENTISATITSGVQATGDLYQMAVYQLEADPAWLEGKLQWTATLDSAVCPVCVGLDKMEVELGTPGPRNWDGQNKIDPHFNCVLGAVPVEAGILAAGTRATYSGNVVTIRTHGGRVLSVTENHPVLTSEGWKAAKLIKEGDKAICKGLPVGRDGVALGGDPDLNQGPATAEQVFALLSHHPAVSRSRVPVTPVDFHGDGSGVNGEIDIACLNRMLLGNCNTANPEEISEALFMVADMRLVQVSGMGALDALLFATHATASGLVRSLNLELALFGGHLGPLEKLSIATAARCDTRFDEPLADGVSLDPKVLGDFVFAHASEIEADEVIDVQIDARRHVEVYDFSTLSGAYFAGGILTHNCRCYMVPAKWRNRRNERIVDGDDGEQALSFSRSAKVWVRENPDTAREIFGQTLGSRLVGSWPDNDWGRRQLERFGPPEVISFNKALKIWQSPAPD
jgi:hypothetical protein